MEISNFIDQFVNCMDPIPTENVTSETQFRDLEVWDSLNALSIMAMVDDEYGVSLTGEEIKKSNTINDLFEIVKIKKG